MSETIEEPMNEKRVLRCRILYLYMNGKRPIEITRELGVPNGYVDNVVMRARKAGCRLPSYLRSAA